MTTRLDMTRWLVPAVGIVLGILIAIALMGQHAAGWQIAVSVVIVVGYAMAVQLLQSRSDVAGVLAGSALLAAPARSDDKPDASKTPAAGKDDKASCGGKDGCGGKKADAKNADKHGCKGQNACKGHGGCATKDHACAGKNACKGQGGCASPKATPTPKAS